MTRRRPDPAAAADPLRPRDPGETAHAAAVRRLAARRDLTPGRFLAFARRLMRPGPI